MRRVIIFSFKSYSRRISIGKYLGDHINMNYKLIQDNNNYKKQTEEDFNNYKKQTDHAIITQFDNYKNQLNDTIVKQFDNLIVKQLDELINKQLKKYNADIREEISKIINNANYMFD